MLVWKKLIHNKRAVSPIISAMLLTALIVVAVGISLTIIYPTLNELNDQIDMSTIGSSMISLDNEFRNLILNGENVKLYKTINVGKNAYLMTDASYYTKLFLMSQVDTNPIQTLDTFYEENNRLVVVETLDGNTIAKNSHSYLIGPGAQDILFLNHTTKTSIPWTILNQSRAENDFLNTSLSYRGVLAVNTEIIPTLMATNITLTLQMVDFVFHGDGIDQTEHPSLQIVYSAINITETSWYTISYTSGSDTMFYFRTIGYMNGLTTTETPFKYEVPVNGNLNIRLKIISHVFDITI